MGDRTLVKVKLKASGLHLALSAGAFCPVLYLILAHWYPQPWFPIDGGWQGVRIMIFVDLVLGPALTFVIYNAAKSRRALAFDFTMIGLTQLCAFVWGVYAVHAQRPVAVVYFDGAFYSFEEKPLLWQGHSAADLKQLDSRVPALLYAKEPVSLEERAAVIDKIRKYELGTYELFDLLRPLAPNLDKLWERSDALAELLWGDPREAARLERLLKEHPGLTREDLRFVWFIGRYEDATLVMTREGQVLGSLRYVQPKKGTKPQRARAGPQG
jgi:hypothetical protein